MPVLKNPRHEAFAQALAKGETADQAYQSAGYKEDRGHASRLAANGSIRQRLTELQSAAAERTLVTIDSITRELDEDRELARSVKQAAAAITATVNKAKLHGLMTDKHEHSGSVTLVIDTGIARAEDREGIDGV